MAGNTALFMGNVGTTGGVTGPHAHFQVYQNGKLIPLSSIRSGIGKNIQFRRPGSEVWEHLYDPRTLALNPSVPLTDPMGVRSTHPVTGVSNAPHTGEDYGLPEGTSLRFLGQGSVTPMENVGRAGNISSAVSGPFKLETFHLKDLPQQASTGNIPLNTSMAPPAAPTLPPPPDAQTRKENSDTRTNDILNAFLYGTKYQDQEVKEPGFKEGLISNLFQGLLQPRSRFIDNYINQNPYLLGRAASTEDYLQGFY